MNIELKPKEFRRLLDMVYIGNWVLNSTRGTDRIPDFDQLESYLFSLCDSVGMESLTSKSGGISAPSAAYREGGIHEAIMNYEDAVFFGILADELAHRDLAAFGDAGDEDAHMVRAEEYLSEFQANGLDNVSVDME
ncbi:MAG: hypothetical protein IKU84_04200 [Clostridia bacterium]|nr:hypothetical protein [Clostridia bacterium]